MGRSGKMFNFAYDNVDPDFVCTGKNTTSGTIPFSFVMSNKNFEKIIIDKIGRVNLGHTFQGHSLGVAAASTVLDIIDKKHLLKRVTKLGGYIQNILHEELKKNHFFPT